MATLSTCPERPRRRGPRLLALTALAGALVAAPLRAQEPEGPTIRWEGPQVGADPGKVKLHGLVRGEGPLVVEVAGERATVKPDGTWVLWRELEIGHQVLEAVVTDASGASARTPHQFRVVPKFDPEDRRPVIYVSNAWALVRALGPRRIVVLRPGEYVVSDATDEKTEEGVEFKGGNLRLRGIDDLEIVGAAGLQSRIVNREPKGTTLVLQDTSSIFLHGVVLEHDPRDESGEKVPEAEGAGVVLSIKNGYQTRLRGCEVTGAGLAFNVNKINGFLVDDSLVHDCTGGIMRANNSKHMVFQYSELLRNGRGREGDIGVVFRGRIRHDITFWKTTMRANRPAPDLGLFDLDECNLQVSFHEGTIKGNHALALSTGASSENLVVSKSKVQANYR
jgi:hypothetical protein